MVARFRAIQRLVEQISPIVPQALPNLCGSQIPPETNLGCPRSLAEALRSHRTFPPANASVSPLISTSPIVRQATHWLLLGRMAGSTILDITYGPDICTSDDPYLKRAVECLKILNQASNPGSYLVDIFLACGPSHSTVPSFLTCSCSVDYVTEWMPGASFKHKAHEWRGAGERFYIIPFEFVKQPIAVVFHLSCAG